MIVTMQNIHSAAEKSKSMPVYPDTRFPPSVYYRFLQALCAMCKPEICVELGVCGGGGSLYMCIGTPGKVIGIDVSNDYKENIEHILGNFSNFTYWTMDSIEAAEHVTEPVDLIFIDTVHTYERTMAEYAAWKPHLSDTAVICLDDLHRGGNG